MTVHARA